jgi:uncharacterized protein
LTIGRHLRFGQAALVAGLALLCACAEPAAEPLTGPARPPMWVIHDADTRIVILGSVHQLPADLEWTGGRLATEIGLADELILELAPAESARAGALFAELANDEAVSSLAARFDDNAPEIRRLAGETGIDVNRAERTESWALALALGNALSRGNNLSAEYGVETGLTQAFSAHDLPVSGLETAQQQLTMFDALPPAQQDQMVRSVLANADDNAQRTGALLRAWAAGDVDALATLAAEAMAETPFLIEPVNLARNRAWAAALVQRLDRRGDVLVAVGVGHLVGEGSLLDALRARGQRPMRLQ